MTDIQALQDQMRAKTERLQLAYQRVFTKGGATKEDRVLVIADLEAFCNVRSDMLSAQHEWQVFGNVGKFRVWQRINAFRFPRPADAAAEFKQTVQRTGGLDGQEDDGRPSPAGRGIPEEVTD